MNQTQILQPTDRLLLERCAGYVGDWYGIDQRAVLAGAQELPAEVPGLFMSIHNQLYGRKSVSNETIAAIGFRTIMQTLHPAPEVEIQRRVVSLVPRHVVEEIRWSSPTMRLYEEELLGRVG